MKRFFAYPFFIFFSVAALVISLSATTGCTYRFNDVSLSDSIKTFYLQPLGNLAPIVNPQLHPTLTQRLSQKITSQTRLNQTNTENNAHYFITGNIVRYDVSTTGVSPNQQNSGRVQAILNRLTVGVKIVLNNQVNGTVQEFDISRSFDFSANQSLQAAENALMDEMIRNLSDEIFNRIFSQW